MGEEVELIKQKIRFLSFKIICLLMWFYIYIYLQVSSAKDHQIAKMLFHTFFLSFLGIYFYFDYVFKKGGWFGPFYKRETGIPAWQCILIDWYLATWFTRGILSKYTLLTNEVVYGVCLTFFLYVQICSLFFKKTLEMFLFGFKLGNSNDKSRFFLLVTNPYLLVSLLPIFFTIKYFFWILCLIWGWRNWSGKSFGYKAGPLFENAK